MREAHGSTEKLISNRLKNVTIIYLNSNRNL
jgi:hypothetical protein